MKSTAIGAVVASMMVAGFGFAFQPSTLSAQTKPTIPIGVWKGAVAATDGVTTYVSYEVKAVGDKLMTISQTRPAPVVELGEISVSGDTIRFQFAPGTKVECIMVRTPSGTYNGGCTDGKLEPARISLTPPKSEAGASAATTAGSVTVDLTAGLYQNLRNFESQQEMYYANPANNYTYATDVKKAGFTPDAGITLTVLEATGKGWSGIVQRTRAAACVVFMGEVAKIPVTPRGTTASASGAIACDPSPGK